MLLSRVLTGMPCDYLRNSKAGKIFWILVATCELIKTNRNSKMKLELYEAL